MLQCLSKAGAEEALKEWYRCLKPGGRLELHVPDLDLIVRQFISTKEHQFLEEIYGKQEYELDYYQTGWTFETLDNLLTRVNFVRVSKIDTPKHRPYALSIIAYKIK
jgi:predicted SAM-dependent methyltransferase